MCGAHTHWDHSTKAVINRTRSNLVFLDDEKVLDDDKNDVLVVRLRVQLYCTGVLLYLFAGFVQLDCEYVSSSIYIYRNHLKALNECR